MAEAVGVEATAVLVVEQPTVGLAEATVVTDLIPMVMEDQSAKGKEQPHVNLESPPAIYMLVEAELGMPEIEPPNTAAREAAETAI